MDFVELLKRLNRDLYDSCDKTALPRLAKAMERTKGITGLLTANDPVLGAFPKESLRRLSLVYSQFENWRTAFRDTRKVLATSRIALPDICLQSTAYPHELSALERIGRMCQRAGYPDLGKWTEAVDAHLNLWNSCVALALRMGTATCRLENPGHPDAAQFENHTFTRQTLTDIRNYTWLGARRGEKAGVLKITLELPTAALVEQTRAVVPSLGMAAKERSVESILAELVTDNLPGTIMYLTDQRASAAAIETAQRAYMSLLETPPLVAEKVMAIYVGSTSKPTGMALLSKSGELLDSAEVSADEPVAQGIARFVQKHTPDAAVLPASAPDSARLREAMDALSGTADLSVTQVLPSAIRAARLDMDLSESPSCLSAVVLGRRALMPMTEWTRIPAAALGLGEYSADLDTDSLNAALLEARLLAALQTDGDPKSAGQGSSAAFAGGASRGRRLNPLVKTIRDLKAGMMLDGVITNLTRFGAFVNIGLTTEAMIHISQLSVEFVDEPSQVVRVGQVVNARIIEVVPEKSRIALSLIPASAVTNRPERAPSRSAAADVARADSLFSADEMARMASAPKFNSPPSSRTARTSPSTSSSDSSSKDKGEPKKSRHEALADLHALFKK